MMSPSAKSVLVTGATGFVGRAIADHLETVGWRTIRAGRRVPAGAKGWFVHGDLDNPECAASSADGRHLSGDLAGSPPTCWLSALADVDAVVHCAGLAHVADTPKARITAQRVNVDATQRLAEQACAAGLKRFIYISTAQVHGATSAPGGALHEDDAPMPADGYAATKLAAEAALTATLAGTATELVILRPAMIYGAGARGNVVRLMKAVAAGVPLPLAQATAPRACLGIGNLCDAAALCLIHPAAPGPAMLVADAAPCSTRDLVIDMGAAVGCRARLFPVPYALANMAAKLSGQQRHLSRLFDPFVLANGRLRGALGWQPRQSRMVGLTALAKTVMAATPKPSASR